MGVMEDMVLVIGAKIDYAFERFLGWWTVD